MFRSVGGLGPATWTNIPLAIAGRAVALATGLVWRSHLDAVPRGEEPADSPGVDVGRLRIIVFLLSALATAVLVALAGVIDFVSLMMPQLADGLVGVRQGALIVTAAMIGGILMLGGEISGGISARHCELGVPGRAR